MSDYRRHTASRDVQIVLVPYEVGTPRETHRVKPGKYPRDRREPWRPATRPPNKAERVVRFLDQCKRQEEAIREMLRPDANLLKAWRSGMVV
jgi:hypothetical protein